MTSPREAVSILTAAALVVAPVGGVAATYTTGYADDQALKHTAEEKTFPKTYEELAERIENGELFSLADLEVMADAKMGFLTAEQYGELYPVFEEMQEALAAEEAAKQAEAEKAAAEQKAAEEKAKAEAEAKAAAEAEAQKAAEEAAKQAEKESQAGDAGQQAGAAAAGEKGESADKTPTNVPVTTDGPAAGTASVEGEGVSAGSSAGDADATENTGTTGGGEAAGEIDGTETEKPVVPDWQNGPNGPMMVGELEKALEELGFQAQVKAVYSDNVPEGAIVYTLPAANETPVDGNVTIVVSKGQLVMPQWADGAMTLDGLKEFFAAVDDRQVKVVVQEEHSDTVAAGAIVRTAPEAGQPVTADMTQVTITVSVGKKPAPVETEKPARPSEPAIDTDNPVDAGVQKPQAGGAGGNTHASQVAAAIKGKAQTPLKQVAVTVPSISFTHIDNSSYVARHYSEDLTTEKFISLVGESARTIAADNDLYASVMIAQAILESASGNSTLAQAPNNNLFGIKGTYNGNAVQLPTREDDGTGATYTIMSNFRQYDNVDESLSDYADLLSNSMGDFYAGARKSNTDTFVDACDFLVGRYATDIFYSEKLQDLIETYDLTRFDVPLTYELGETFVLPVKDEVTGLDKYVDPVTQKAEYDALVAEYRAYVDRTSEYQQSLAEWQQQMDAAEALYHVPVYLEKPSMPDADTAMQQHADAIDAERFEGFDSLIAAGQPLPVREARTLNDLTAMATSFLGVPYLWGGTTPAGFDCSGLVQYCYREVFNIELPRTTYYQCDVGEEVPFEELLPGDLLFFDDGGDVHHVAMYLGDGYYVEAPHTGDVVKITAMNDKLPSFAKRIVDVRSIDMTEFSDEQLAQFVEREKYLQEREQRLGVTDDTLAELTEWLRGLEF